MSVIVDHLSPNSIVLFNESFSATNEREGSEIARQITTALLEKHIKVFYVTHQYEFAYGFYEKHLNNAIFLRADRKTGGVRTFKLIEGRPLQTSFGEDVYQKIFQSESVETKQVPEKA
jgi:DNA mismatch repair ATPase MutS